MFLITSIVFFIIYIIYGCIIAFGYNTQHSVYDQSEKDRLDAYISNESSWTKMPLCPIKREGDKLICTAPEHYYLTGKTINPTTRFEVKYGYNGKWGILDADSDQLLFTPDDISFWCQNTNRANWIQIGDISDSKYVCSGCGYTLENIAFAPFYCPNCHRYINNHVR